MFAHTTFGMSDPVIVQPIVPTCLGRGLLKSRRSPHAKYVAFSTIGQYPSLVDLPVLALPYITLKIFTGRSRPFAKTRAPSDPDLQAIQVRVLNTELFEFFGASYLCQI